VSNIEWTDETWNPVLGCRRVSEGCRNCYAERMAARLANNPKTPQYDGVAEFTDDGPRWTGKVVTLPEKLAEPLSWQKPRRVFVNSMSDLFHEDVPFEFIAAVYGVMAACSDHTFQVLTKRPERALEFFRWVEKKAQDGFGADTDEYDLEVCKLAAERAVDGPVICSSRQWPPPNVWLGVSAEDQTAADERVPLLLECPAAVRFVSAEPLIGAIEIPLRCPLCDGKGYYMVYGDWEPKYEETCNCGGDPVIDWIIVGGESGPGARPMQLDWVRSIRDQCEAADVPLFVKQLGKHPVAGGEYGPDQTAKISHPKGADPSEWPKELRVREWPEVVGGTS